jgi:beta-aspartyl-peptidase (threonine type)
MICARVAMQEMSAADAARVTLEEVRALGGEGGVIVLSRDGSSALSMNTEGMYRGYADATGARSVAIYADE